MATKQKTKKQHFAEESVETKGSVSSAVKNEGKKIAKDSLDAFWKQLLAGSVPTAGEQLAHIKQDQKKASGDLKMGEEVSLKKQEEEIEEKAEALALKREFHRDYYKETVESIDVKATRELDYNRSRQIEEIKLEIKQLIKSSKQMEVAFKDVAAQIDSPIEKPGTYHLNFLDWILVTMKNVRARMEEGVSWAKTLSNKRAEKKYWNMAKKHGTTFSLSQERSTATQTG